MSVLVIQEENVRWPRRMLLLVSHVLRTRLKKKGQTDRRTDGRQTVTLLLPLNAVIVIKDDDDNNDGNDDKED